MGSDPIMGLGPKGIRRHGDGIKFRGTDRGNRAVSGIMYPTLGASGADALQACGGHLGYTTAGYMAFSRPWPVFRGRHPEVRPPKFLHGNRPNGIIPGASFNAGTAAGSAIAQPFPHPVP